MAATTKKNLEEEHPCTQYICIAINSLRSVTASAWLKNGGEAKALRLLTWPVISEHRMREEPRACDLQDCVSFKLHGHEVQI